MRISVLGDRATVEAMRLAGIEGEVVGESQDPAAAFDRLLRQDDLGVLLVTEPLASAMRAKVDAAKLTRRFPLVLEVPARGVPSIPADDLVARVARSVGLRG